MCLFVFATFICYTREQPSLSGKGDGLDPAIRICFAADFVVFLKCSSTNFVVVVKRSQIRSLDSLPSDITPVIDAYQHALLASYPRPRYLVGCDAVLMAVLAPLPEFITDWILAKRLQLPGRVNST